MFFLVFAVRLLFFFFSILVRFRFPAVRASASSFLADCGLHFSSMLVSCFGGSALPCLALFCIRSSRAFPLPVLAFAWINSSACGGFVVLCLPCLVFGPYCYLSHLCTYTSGFSWCLASVWIGQPAPVLSTRFAHVCHAPSSFLLLAHGMTKNI